MGGCGGVCDGDLRRYWARGRERWGEGDEFGDGCTNLGEAAEALRMCDLPVTPFLLSFACPGGVDCRCTHLSIIGT
jgi:hypothetical protein